MLNTSNRVFGASSVHYGIERMNAEVSLWMLGEHVRDATLPMPFIATRGYKSVVWNRLYSREISEYEDSEINKVCSSWMCSFYYILAGWNVIFVTSLFNQEKCGCNPENSERCHPNNFLIFCY